MREAANHSRQMAPGRGVHDLQPATVLHGGRGTCVATPLQPCYDRHVLSALLKSMLMTILKTIELLLRD